MTNYKIIYNHKTAKIFFGNNSYIHFGINVFLKKLAQSRIYKDAPRISYVEGTK